MGAGGMFCQEEAVFLHGRRLTRVICRVEAEKYHHAFVVCALLRCQEGKIKKLAKLEHSPGEAACPYIDKCTDICAQGQGHARVGGGYIAMFSGGR
jgi:hypothetical protein